MSFLTISEDDEKSIPDDSIIEDNKDENPSDVVEVELGLGEDNNIKIEEIVRNELEPMIDKMPNDDNNIGGGGWKFNLDDAPQSNTDPQ